MVLFGKIDKREFREEPAATAAVEKRPLRPPSGRTSKKRNVGSRIPEARDVRAFAILSGASSSGAKGERQMKTTRVSSCNYSACAHRDPNLLVLKFEPLACVMGSRPRPVAYVPPLLYWNLRTRSVVSFCVSSAHGICAPRIRHYYCFLLGTARECLREQSTHALYNSCNAVQQLSRTRRLTLPASLPNS